MVQPTDSGAFGRKQVAPAAMGTTSPTNRPRPRPSADPINPALKFLDRLFLWLPNDRAPGATDVGLFLLRQVTLPFVLTIAPLAAVMIAFPKINLVQGANQIPNWVAMLFISLCIGPVQELGRYSFVRHADRPLRSLLVFASAPVIWALISDHDRIYTLSWSIAAQAAASAALFFGLGQRRYIGAIVVAIILGHVAVDVIAPQFFRPPDEAASAKNAQPIAPAVGDMQSWAKLYPDALITESKSETFLGLTSWKVTYRVHASPDQIEAFYEAIATQRGFTDTQSLGGLHVFRQHSTHDDFSYAASSDAAGSQVVFQARTFGRAARSD